MASAGKLSLRLLNASCPDSADEIPLAGRMVGSLNNASLLNAMLTNACLLGTELRGARLHGAKMKAA